MTPRAVSTVTRLLALSPALGTPRCPVRNLEDASVWADCVRANYRDRYAVTATWHYVDVSVCRPFLLPPDPDARFVVRRLETEIVALRDRTAPPLRRLQALLWVVHLIGDIHQPLHVGDRHDRGGNELRVDGARWRHSANLHAEWDRDLVDSVIRDREGGVAGLALDATDLRSSQSFAPDPAVWARQTWTLARQAAYGGIVRSRSCFISPENVVLDDAYIGAARSVVRDQLEFAGIRLAAMLNGLDHR